jgi:hypothetical protein
MIPRGKVYVADKFANIKTRRFSHENYTDNLDRGRACERIGDQLRRPNTGGGTYTSARYIGAGGYQAARGAGTGLY